MSHRTLVAYDRDGYDLHDAQMGVDPASITPEMPFGKPQEASQSRCQADQGIPTVGGGLADSPEFAVETNPIATDLTFVELGAYLDPIEHESLYIVDSTFAVRTYVVYGLEGRSFGPPDAPTIAVIGYEGEADAAHLRGWLAGARAVRSVCGPEPGAIVKALRWLDPERGAVVWLTGGPGDSNGGKNG